MKNKATYSNSFPREKDKEKNIPVQTRANIIWKGLEENLPELYNYIMNKKDKDEKFKV